MRTQFQLFNYYVNNLITLEDISLAVNKFHQENLVGMNNNIRVAILFKVRTSDGCLRNISPLQIIDKNGIEDLKFVLNTFWFNKLHIYQKKRIKSIVFIYKYVECQAIPDLFPRKCIFNYLTPFYTNKALLPEGYDDLPNNRQLET